MNTLEMLLASLILVLLIGIFFLMRENQRLLNEKAMENLRRKYYRDIFISSQLAVEAYQKTFDNYIETNTLKMQPIQKEHSEYVKSMLVD